jgi:hypothetical protein
MLLFLCCCSYAVPMLLFPCRCFYAAVPMLLFRAADDEQGVTRELIFANRATQNSKMKISTNLGHRLRP